MKIGIVGLGLMGGSIAQASSSVGHEIWAYDSSSEATTSALTSGAIDHVSTIEEMRDLCDLVILCVPTRTATELVESTLSGSALVTDVSSVKTPICEKVSSLSPEMQERFIGGHPMAGSEQSGFDASRPDLFENKMWIIVPPVNNSLTHVQEIENFVFSLGAEHCVLSPEQHDSLVAYISHLPQLASSTLMDLASTQAVDNEIILRLAGGGFRDMTRIAANNAAMWLDIVHDNADEISAALGSYIESLEKLKQDIDARSQEPVEKLFSRARSARRSLPEAARRLDNLSEVLIPIPDKPGVLTTITSLASDINIYDIKIVHALEEDRGVLSLIVDPTSVEELTARLIADGFTVKSVELSSNTDA